MPGKIIAIVGAPRAGKSYLAQKLAVNLGAELYLEGESEDLPSRIIEDIEQNIRPMERIIWFRNMLVQKYQQALADASAGRTVVMDMFWLGPHLYVDALIEDEFEKDVVRSLLQLDRHLLPWPDIIIHLKLSESKMREYLAAGKRGFDQAESFLSEQAIPVAYAWEQLMREDKQLFERGLTIERDGMDFEDLTDLQAVVDRIKARM